ncbi:MAG: adenylate kinase [Actinomycetaceae bacterium]|nr:adenylate kinase [Actinomycetaceae bacterium]MDU0970394.1 adenylate kinase [Actinomycetaceae bacterium]
MTISRVLLIGPPGAGKGTQAGRLCDTLGIVPLSTGQVFRENISGGTELGKLAQSYMEKGEFVPDQVTNSLVADALHSDRFAAGFMLDGYPRTQAQAEYLDGVLEADGKALDLVIEIDVNEDDLVDRLLKRATIEGRADDTEPVIRHRMEVYKEQTLPLIAFYRDRGLLKVVDGNGTIDEVWERIEALLK